MPNTVSFQAKWVYPVNGPAIENGVVGVSDGRVISVSKSTTRASKTVDLGAVALIPGLINAHTHLEFSHLDQPLGESGMPFTKWIAMLVANRSGTSAEQKTDAIKKGLAESIESGVVAIGEIGTAPIQDTDYGHEIETTLFFERLGRDENKVDATSRVCKNWLASLNPAPNIHPAISPHAPYSVHPELLKNLIRQSRLFGCPVAMHLAETREEIELLESQTGPFVDLLESLDAWHPDSYPSGIQIIDYLKQLSRVNCSLIIHGNYLSESDIDFVASNRTTMSAVYCPRTHDYFGHQVYPLTNLRKAGINVAVGTDSRASNPDLSLFDELKRIRQKYPDMTTDQILRMGTHAGSIALSIEDRFGVIEVGRHANLNAVDVDDNGEIFNIESCCKPLAAHRANC